MKVTVTVPNAAYEGWRKGVLFTNGAATLENPDESWVNAMRAYGYDVHVEAEGAAQEPVQAPEAAGQPTDAAKPADGPAQADLKPRPRRARKAGA